MHLSTYQFNKKVRETEVFRGSALCNFEAHLRFTSKGQFDWWNIKRWVSCIHQPQPTFEILYRVIYCSQDNGSKLSIAKGRYACQRAYEFMKRRIQNVKERWYVFNIVIWYVLRMGKLMCFMLKHVASTWEGQSQDIHNHISYYNIATKLTTIKLVLSQCNRKAYTITVHFRGQWSWTSVQYYHHIIWYCITR